jgi:hypothetical protein
VLVSADNRNLLLKPESLLPSTLTDLHITHISREELQMIVQHYCTAIIRDTAMIEPIVLDFASKCSIRHISVTAYNCKNDNEFVRTKGPLVRIAQFLERQTGICLEIYRTALTRAGETSPKFVGE